MAQSTARKPRMMSFAVNPETFEVYERTPEAQWKHKLEQWRKCLSLARKVSSYHLTAIPSPMPWGHVMFRTSKDNRYHPCASPPEPVWSDGNSVLYAGQRVGWSVYIGLAGYHAWFYGIVLGLDENDATKLLIRRDIGGTCIVNPYLPEL